MLIGWREWVALPELGLSRIKAKIDTGARTSALHAFSLHTPDEPVHHKQKVCFKVRSLTRQGTRRVIECVADLVDIREITDSGGHKERRYVICTPLIVGQYSWPIEITLTSRDNMRFKMLLGRTALSNRFIVDPGRSYLLQHKK
ncbi:ATP-dependent zinc protease family protein [Rickettsiella massiliensis]|uniref:ATP-dependent zinc protease family protein n=1 Tax=Rickettsiella massiliensis TaxID=676517 RepID=UPI001F20C559|nr:RimK/LysX family protein [Rickettsiella massiliensis]